MSFYKFGVKEGKNEKINVEYDKYTFVKVLNKAKYACRNSGFNVDLGQIYFAVQTRIT